MNPLIETNARTISIAILLLGVMAGLIAFVAGAARRKKEKVNVNFSTAF